MAITLLLLVAGGAVAYPTGSPPSRPLPRDLRLSYFFETRARVAEMTVDKNWAFVFGRLDRRGRYVCLSSGEKARLRELLRALDGRRNRTIKGRPFADTLNQEIQARTGHRILRVVTSVSQERVVSIRVRRLGYYLHRIERRYRRSARSVPRDESVSLCARST